MAARHEPSPHSDLSQAPGLPPSTTQGDIFVGASIAATLKQAALTWLPKFKDKVITIKIGGSIFEPDNQKSLDCIAKDIRALNQLGVCPVVIHGGGNAITRALKKINIETSRIDGLRVTPEETMPTIRRVLCEEMNKDVADLIDSTGKTVKRFTNPAIFQADFLDLEKYGFVGDVQKINETWLKNIKDALADGKIPIVSSVGISKNGDLLNIDADMAAAAIAKGLNANRHIFITENPVLNEPGNLDTRLPSVKISEIQGLIERGNLVEGMIPKLNTASNLVQSGVEGVSVVASTTPNRILLELIMNTSIGTRITA